MAKRYADWMRRVGFHNATPYQLDEAKRLLGFVALRAESLGALHSLRLRRILADGSAIVATIMGGQRTIELEPVTVPQVTELTEVSRIWIPRGFVVYPSTSSHLHGWGQPALVADGADPWSRASLAPGTDPAKWTDGGPLGEVLITRDKNAGYSSLTKPAGPLFFEKTEVRTSLPAGHWTAPRTGDWAGYRSEYVDYTQAPVFGRDLFIYTNTQRSTPLTPWFRGYFEEAVYLSEKVPATEFDGANPTLPPSVVLDGYSTAAKRLNKDGGVDEASADAVTSNQTTIPNVASAFDSAINIYSDTFDPSCSFGIGIVGNVAVAEVAKRAQWIRYGDAKWFSGVTDHPILSWGGGYSWQLPVYMITLPFFFDGSHMQPFGGPTVGPYPDYEILSDLSTITASVRGRQKALFSKELFARGRVLGRFDGYVFGAAVQVVSEDPQNVHDRLLVLTWHAEDQDVYVPPGGGSLLDPPEPHILRQLRLYFIDVVPRNGLRLNPEHMLRQGDMKLAGYLPMTDFSEERSYPTKFPRQMPRFSHDGKKLIQVIGEYGVDGGFTEIFTHDLAEYSLGNIGEGVLTYTRNVIAHGMGGPNVFFPDESFEVADYNNDNTYTSLISYLFPWPYDDLFPGAGTGATRDTRVISRPDHSGQMPYATETGEPIDPQCVAAYYVSVSVFDVNHYAAASVYLTGNCSTLSAWSSRLVIMHEGQRIYDQVSPQNSTNRIYGGNGSGHWYDGSYARIGDDYVFTVEVGAFKDETYIVNNSHSVVIAGTDSRVTGYVFSTLPDIITLVGGEADCLFPAGVV